MNKRELVAAVAKAANLTKGEATLAVNAVAETIAEAMKNGDTVRLVGFGNFEVRERAAKVARNPRTGEMITVPAAKVPAFKAGAELKAKVNE